MVLCTLWEQPSHPYQIVQTLKARHKDKSARLNYGSLYTVVAALEKGGAIEAVEVTREGNLPPRTTYRITAAGMKKMNGWLSDLVADPKPEIPAFMTALSVLPVLPIDRATELLAQRADKLEAQIEALEQEIRDIGDQVPELMQIETQYQLSLLRAELAFTRQLTVTIEQGTMSGMAAWKQIHGALVDGRPDPQLLAAAFAQDGFSKAVSPRTASMPNNAAFAQGDSDAE
jgi:DNA-binding PadR family transcriptional regulator